MLKIWTVFSKMGVIFSRFRKKSSVQLLENVEEEIKELEACSADTALRHRKITRQLMIYSSGLCVMLSILLYFYFPRKLETKIILISLLMLSPVTYIIVSRIISWYYNRKIRSSHSRLKDLKKEKKRLIDEIMDKETYKVAKDILEKYAPETLPNKYPPMTRSLPASTAAMVQNKPLAMVAQVTQVRTGPVPLMNQRVISNMPFSGGPPPPNAAAQGRPPQHPRDKSYMERMFEYLVGDGPNNRYALICRNCSTHNGMALVEEFEYTAFKCYACSFFNPARKQRPIAPKLMFEGVEQDTASERESGSSSAEEIEGDKGANEDPSSGVVDGDVEKLESRESVQEEERSTPALDSAESLSLREDTASSEELKTEDPAAELRPEEEEEEVLKKRINKEIKSDSVLKGT